jgi:hypothetical protein
MIDIKRVFVDDLYRFFENEWNDLLLDVISAILKSDAPAFDNLL